NSARAEHPTGLWRLVFGPQAPAAALHAATSARLRLRVVGGRTRGRRGRGQKGRPRRTPNALGTKTEPRLAPRRTGRPTPGTRVRTRQLRAHCRLVAAHHAS